MKKKSSDNSLSVNMPDRIFLKIIRVTTITIFLAAGIRISSSAQDIMKLKSGKEIKVNIIEEGTDIIKYRDFDNPSGPLYTIKKEQVESVKYKKGSRTTQTDQGKAVINDQAARPDTGRYLTVKKRYILLNGVAQPPRSVRTLMEDNQEALMMYQKGRKQTSASNTFAMAIVVVSFTATMISNGKSNPDDSRRIAAIGLGIDGGLLIAGIILASKGKKNIKRSVELYNSSLNKPVSYKLDFGIQDNGVGFSIRF